jgi:DNA polymerase delta subunit 1
VRDYIMKDAHAPAFRMVLNGVNDRARNRVFGPPVSAVGGWVLSNKAGLHDKPVVVLDFASLYPSVQMAFNLCWSTVVYGDAVTPAHEAAGLVVRTFETPTGTFRFVQNVPGVAPQSLRTKKAERAAYKAVLAAATRGSAQYQNASNAEKAIKVPMNSLYGAANTDEAEGVLPCRALGTVTTHMGR